MKREATMAAIRSPKVSGTKNAGTGPYKAISGMGFPIHKPENIQRECQDPSILGIQGIYLKCLAIELVSHKIHVIFTYMYHKFYAIHV